MNVHKRCQKNVANNCGINPKQLAETLMAMGISGDKLNRRKKKSSSESSNNNNTVVTNDISPNLNATSGLFEKNLSDDEDSISPLLLAQLNLHDNVSEKKEQIKVKIL